MLQIANLSFPSPFVLAPLAGFTDLPFRLICRHFGAGYCVSEMISCHGLVYKHEATLRLMSSIEEERPVAFQLFGADPVIMAEAAEIVASRRPEMIDINMGCPVKKVTKKGAGAALMANIKLAENIIGAIVKRVKIPVTVKIRSGVDARNQNAAEFAKMAEGQGASAIAVHARSWAQGFAGNSDPEIIASVKKSVKIPVIGNGDILSHDDGLQLMHKTGCDGVMIGRGALGNPWIFNEGGRPSTLSALANGAYNHLLLVEKYLPGNKNIGHIKSQIARYFKALPGSAAIRAEIFTTKNLDHLREILLRFQCSS